MLNGLDKIVGNAKVLDDIVKSIAWSARLGLATLTFGTSEWIRLVIYLKQLRSGELEYNRREKEYMENRKKAQEEINRLKREELELRNRANAALAVRENAEKTQLSHMERMVKLQAEIDSNSTDPAVKAQAEKDLQKLEREADLQKEIEESQKRIDAETDETIAAAGQYNLSEKDKKMIRADAEQRKIDEEARIGQKHAAQNAQEDRDKAAKDQKKLDDEAEKAKEAQRKADDAHWRRQMDQAKKLVKEAQKKQDEFEKQLDEEGKHAGASGPSANFQANSVAEFTFRKEKEMHAIKKREENEREARREAHAEQLNLDLIGALNDMNINEHDEELGFEAIN